MECQIIIKSFSLKFSSKYGMSDNHQVLALARSFTKLTGPVLARVNLQSSSVQCHCPGWVLQRTARAAHCTKSRARATTLTGLATAITTRIAFQRLRNARPRDHWTRQPTGMSDTRHGPLRALHVLIDKIAFHAFIAPTGRNMSDRHWHTGATADPVPDRHAGPVPGKKKPNRHKGPGIDQADTARATRTRTPPPPTSHTRLSLGVGGWVPTAL
jgi:hypothetical protein